jgi:hypothetical protein
VLAVLIHLDDRRGDLAGTVTAALGVAIVAGSAVLWIGIPLLGLWLAGRLTTTAEAFLFATLGGIPLAMVAFGWVLYRVNYLYLRSRGPDGQAQRNHSAWLVSVSDERGRSRRERAPRRLIDLAMTVSLTVALVAMVIWFFFLSEMWLVNPL